MDTYSEQYRHQCEVRWPCLRIEMTSEELLEIKVQHNARLRAEVMALQKRLERLQDFVAGLTDPERDGWLVQPQVRRKAAYFLKEADK